MAVVVVIESTQQVILQMNLLVLPTNHRKLSLKTINFWPEFAALERNFLVAQLKEETH